MHPRLEIRNVSKVYTTTAMEASLSLGRALLWGKAPEKRKDSSIVAVDDVSLTVEPGERVGIIGRNGAGKSTLVHMIADLTEPTSGDIEVEGHVTAVMTMGLGLREDLTGRESIYLDGDIQGRTREHVDELIDQIIDFTELDEFIDFPIRTYSTGMKSRLAFSMLVHIEPEILIIDEVLSAGDAKFSIKATARFKEICEAGKIIINVSHSMGAIVEMCNRCLWMEAGKIIMDGHPSEVTQAYLEDVRKQDEAALSRRYEAVLTESSAKGSGGVKDILVRHVGEAEHRAVLSSEEELEVCIEVEPPESSGIAEIALQITRADGLLIDELNLSEHFTFAQDGTDAFQIRIPPLVLSAAIYFFRATMHTKDGNSTTKAIVAEVTVPSPPIGGRPILLCHGTISSNRIA